MRTPTPLPERTDAAREQAIRLLTDRYADGTLDEAGFEAQLARLRTADDTTALEALSRDLAHAAPPPVAASRFDPPAPALVPPPRDALPAVPAETRIRAILGEARRQGWWRVPRWLEATAILGNVKLDFREAALPDVVEVVVEACLGEVVLIVPPDVTVDFDVSPVLGTAVSRAPVRRPTPGIPHLRVTGTSVLAEVKLVVRGRDG